MEEKDRKSFGATKKVAIGVPVITEQIGCNGNIAKGVRFPPHLQNKLNLKTYTYTKNQCPYRGRLTYGKYHKKVYFSNQ